jgi:hypothetical protein
MDSSLADNHVIQKNSRAEFFRRNGFHKVSTAGRPSQNCANPSGKTHLAAKTGRCQASAPGVTLAQTGSHSSDRAWATQNSRRKEKNRPQQHQNAVHGDSHDPKRQQNQPNKGIEHQRQQRKRPTKEKQDTPEKKSNHGGHLTSYYARARFEVPSFVNAFSFSLRAIDTGTSASSNICESSTSECSTRPSA